MMYEIKIGADPEHPDYAIHGGAFLRLNDSFIPVVPIAGQHFFYSFSKTIL
jgi:hypothetical protein